jgi:hypothetical protein
MLKHIVMWKFKDAAEGSAKSENLRRAKTLLDALPEKIAHIKSFEVGVDILHSDSSYDLVLNSAFDNHETLVAYQRHPEHVSVVDFLRKVQIGKVVVDYVD